jgi:DNA-binding winged helix-turn-helix (wHTH) protein/TolB-like protein/Flp pilus assembly protein TadD
MADQFKSIYEFGRFLLDAGERSLLRDGQPVALTPKAFDTLLVLVQNSGHVLEKDELMKAVWPDSFVEEVNLAHNISVLRKALGGKEAESRFIETVPRRGYRFIAPVKDRTREGTFTVLAERTRSTMLVEEEVLNAKLSEEFVSAERTRESIVVGEEEQTSVKSANKAESGGLIRRVVSGKYAVVIALCSILVGSTALLFYIAALQRPQRVADLRIKSIAVLPFKPLGGDNVDESLGMGLAEALISKLSSIRELIVRPVGSVVKYTGLEQDAIAAGREQRVDAVLDGTFQKDGDRIRVTPRFFSVQDGSVLWEDKFDQNFTNILSVQDAIAQRIVGVLALKLSSNEHELLSKHYTQNTDAYQLYLRGSHFWNKRTRESLMKAAECFNRAISLDPNYALAYSGLADCHSLLASDYGVPDGYVRAAQAALKAVELDDSLAEAHTSLAFLRWQGLHASPASAASDAGDYLSSIEAEFRRAIELDPNYPTARHWYSNFLVSQGRLGESLEQIERARELDPLSIRINSALGTRLYYGHRYDEAVEQLKRTIELDPESYPAPHGTLGLVYLQQQRYQLAIDEFQKARKLSGRPEYDADVSQVLIVNSYALAGRTAEARRELDKLQRRLRKNNELTSADMSIICLAMGQKDRAIQFLEKGLEKHDWDIGSMLFFDPLLDSLRSDRGFADLLRRARLETTGDRPAHAALAESANH